MTEEPTVEKPTRPWRPSWVLWTIFAGIGAVVALFAYGFSLNPKLVDSPLIDQTAPAFSAQALNGGAPLQLEAFKGRAVILNFWASWCVACREEATLLEGVHRGYQGKVRVLGIAIQDTPKNASAFARRFGKTYPLALDNAAGDISLSYGLYGVPETFFIDSKGIIRSKHIGALTPALLKAELPRLLEQTAGGGS